MLGLTSDLNSCYHNVMATAEYKPKRSVGVVVIHYLIMLSLMANDSALPLTNNDIIKIMTHFTIVSNYRTIVRRV